MKTTRQIYEDYLEAQEKKLEKLRKEIDATIRDIKNVKDMLGEYEQAD